MNTYCEYTGKKTDRGQQPVCNDAISSATPRCSHFSPEVDFNPCTAQGTIILNIICVAHETADEALHIIKSVLSSPYAFSSRFAVARGGACIGDFEVPVNKTAFCTVCSMTLNALLHNHGIHAATKFGGVVEVEHHQPKKFSAFLSSGLAPLAPLDIFISCAMTSICKTIQSGRGDVLASFLEIPESFLPDAIKIYDRIKKIGLGGKIMFGMPSQPLLGMPVSIGYAGIVVFRALNTAAALKEKGINAIVHPAKMLCNYTALT